MGYASNLNLAIFPRVLLTAVERAGIWLLELATVLVKGHAMYRSCSYLFSYFRHHTDGATLKFTNLMVLKATVNIAWILCKTCMFFGVFRFVKKLKFLNKSGIHSISRSLRDSGTLLSYALVLIGRNGGG